MPLESKRKFRNGSSVVWGMQRKGRVKEGKREREEREREREREKGGKGEEVEGKVMI